MAKNSDAKPTAGTPGRKVAAKENSLSPGVRADKKDSLATSDGERVAEGRVRARPSPLVDTRVIYCGDNVDQLKKLPDACHKPMQNEEGRMMKPARFPILHSSFCLFNSPVTGSFYYHCDWHASHYVKVMLDQAVN
jgi:hypothetical protein